MMALEAQHIQGIVHHWRRLNTKGLLGSVEVFTSADDEAVSYLPLY